jgi:hypothetical protein
VARPAPRLIARWELYPISATVTIAIRVLWRGSNGLLTIVRHFRLRWVPATAGIFVAPKRVSTRAAGRVNLEAASAPDQGSAGRSPAMGPGAGTKGKAGSHPGLVCGQRELERQRFCGSRVRSDSPPRPDLGFVRRPRRSSSWGCFPMRLARPPVDAGLGIIAHFCRRSHRDLDLIQWPSALRRDLPHPGRSPPWPGAPALLRPDGGDILRFKRVRRP